MYLVSNTSPHLLIKNLIEIELSDIRVTYKNLLDACLSARYVEYKNDERDVNKAKEYLEVKKKFAIQISLDQKKRLTRD